MSIKHVLLELANTYPIPDRKLDPEGYYYDEQIGAWVDQQDKTLLVRTEKKPTPQTKKMDIETGEDQKGE